LLPAARDIWLAYLPWAAAIGERRDQGSDQCV
jgi:hypothetical protein